MADQQAELLRRLAELEREIEEQRRLRQRAEGRGEEERRRGEEERRRRQQAERRGELRRSLSNGTYFATIDDVLESHRVDPFSWHLYKQCCRPEGASNQMYCRTASNTGTVSANNPYKETLDNAAGGDARDNESRTTFDVPKRDAVWATSVFGPERVGAIAHLVPKSPQHAESYWFVTDFLYGASRNRDWATRRRMIHGVGTSSGRARKGHTGTRQWCLTKYASQIRKTTWTQVLAS